MICSEFDELAGAFALGALPAAESSACEEHLATCEVGHPGLAELLEVASLLPFAADEVEPPVRLLDNLIAAALAERPDRQAGEPPASAAIPPAVAAMPADGGAAPVPIATARRRRAWASPGIWAAAALLLIAIGLGAWNVSLRRSLDDKTNDADRQARALAALTSGKQVVPLTGQSSGQIALVENPDGSASLVLRNVPPAPPGKVYEAWFIRDGKPVGAGLFSANGEIVVPLQGSPLGAQLVAVTVEPTGGSPQPTSDIIAKAPLG